MIFVGVLVLVLFFSSSNSDESQIRDSTQVLGQQLIPVVDSSAGQLIIVESADSSLQNQAGSLPVVSGSQSAGQLQVLSGSQGLQPLNQSGANRPSVIQNATLQNGASTGAELNINSSSSRSLEANQ